MARPSLFFVRFLPCFVFFHLLTLFIFSLFLSIFSYSHGNLSFSSAIFFSQILTLSLSFFCRGNTSIVSVWIGCSAWRNRSALHCGLLLFLLFLYAHCLLEVKIYMGLWLLFGLRYTCLWSLAQVSDGNDGCVFTYNKCFPTWVRRF